MIMEKEKNQENSNSHRPYRGHQSYINYLGRYVGVFEDVINKKLTSVVGFKKCFPESVHSFDKEIKKHVGHSTSEKMEKTLKRTGITLAFNGSNCLLYELCRHIRNSYCHLLLEIDGDKLKVIDKSRGKITSTGYLPKKVLIDFVKSIVNEYENSFKKK